jgi:hypothetical protein
MSQRIEEALRQIALLEKEIARLVAAGPQTAILVADRKISLADWRRELAYAERFLD